MAEPRETAEGAPGADRAPRWLLPLLRVLGLVYGPALLPYLVGPLGECSHCVGVYTSMLPIAPGAVGLMAPLPNAGRFALCALLSVVVLALAGLTQRAPRPLVRRIGGGLVALLVGLEALALGSLLRM